MTTIQFMEFRSEHGSHIKLIWNLNGQKLNKKVQILVSGGMSYIKKISNLAEKKYDAKIFKII